MVIKNGGGGETNDSKKKKIAAETLLNSKVQVNVNGTGNKASYSGWQR